MTRTPLPAREIAPRDNLSASVRSFDELEDDRTSEQPVTMALNTLQPSITREELLNRARQPIELLQTGREQYVTQDPGEKNADS